MLAYDQFQAIAGEWKYLEIKRNGIEISREQLEREAGHYVAPDSCSDIDAVRESQTSLPSTYRRAIDGGADIGVGSDGTARAVDRPRNPEDRYRE